MVIWLSVLGFIVACILSLVLTPVVKKFAFKIGAVAVPNHRSVHTGIMPRLGGLAIFLSFSAAFFIAVPVMGKEWRLFVGLFLGGIIMEVIGVLDDKYELSAKIKLAGQIVAATVVALFGLQIDWVEWLQLPIGQTGYELAKWISIPLTIFWIVAVTNAINLIDGLDGLAAGVSSIASGAILAMAIIMNNAPIIVLSSILLGSLLGFLRYNFIPAKIFMGDSGSLFLGYILATMSIFGYKQVTFVSLIIPILILGVPLSDTILAMIRRKLNNVPMFRADKGHLHHALLQFGFSQRKTILIIYGISIFFGLCAVLLSRDIQWLTVIIIFLSLILFMICAELVGAFGKRKRPILHFLQKVFNKSMDVR